MKPINAQRIAKVTGIFFIFATVGSVIAAVFLGPILAEPDFMMAISQNPNGVVFAIISMFVAVISILGIPITLFPILRRHNENLTIWFSCARLFEALFYMVAVVFLLALLALTHSGAIGNNLTQSGALMRMLSDVAFNLGTLVIFSLSAIILGIILFQSKLVPRWLSIWAIFGGMLLFIEGMLVIADLSTPMLEASLFIPIALNEMVLAGWLLVKGFSPDALVSLMIEPDHLATEITTANV